ncbi:MAG: pyridoxal-phosphate dependent enzyme [Candidatus Hodarchaeales archaeon]|jgi:threonine synthase
MVSVDQGIWHFSDWLPPFSKKISMGEGHTPLLEISPPIKSRLKDTESIGELYFKNETLNPTGSFHDRAAALAVSEALSKGFDSIVVASDGNHGVSVAAYAAYAGVRCHCIVPHRTDAGKVRIMKIYGASIDTDSEENLLGATIRANRYAEEMASFQASIGENPTCLIGQETLAFELASEKALQGKDYALIVPTGSGSLIYSLSQGFERLQDAGEISTIPHLCAVQIAGYDPISSTLHSREPVTQMSKEAFFVSPLMIDFPPYKDHAVKAIKKSVGDSFSIDQQRVTTVAVQLARNFGFFVENASAAAIAALPFLQNHPQLNELPVVIILTGSGIKTPELFPFPSNIHLKKSPTELLPTSMKIAILRVLEERVEGTGREIWRLLGRKVSPQVIYQHLRDLRDSGFVQSLDPSGRTKKYYITSRGFKLLEILKD